MRCAMRYPMLDGLRGLFLIFVMSVHLNQYVATKIWLVSPMFFGFADAAQGFVFMSGMLAGVVYGGKLVRGTPEAMRTALRKRWLTIYTYHASLILIFLAAAVVLGSVGGELLRPYTEHPVAFTLASLMLLTCSHDMGILAMYLYFIAATPLLLAWFHRGNAIPVLVGSLLFWLAGQLMLISAGAEAASAEAARMGYDISFELGFNLLGWQIMYVMGLYIGYRLVTGTIDLSFLHRPQFQTVFYMCLAATLILFVVRQLNLHGWPNDAFADRFKDVMHRRNVSVLHLIAFLMDLFMVTWLVHVAAQGQNPRLRKAGLFIKWLFTRRALTVLGQHSLQVFAWHLLVLYGVILLIGDQHVGERRGTLIVLAAILSLYIPAYVHAAFTRRRKRGTKATVPSSGRDPLAI